MWLNLLIILGTCVVGVVLGFFVSWIITNVKNKTPQASQSSSVKGERYNLKIDAPTQDLVRKEEGPYDIEIPKDDSSPSYHSLLDIMPVESVEEPVNQNPQLIDEISIRPEESRVTASHALMDEISIKPSPGPVHIEYEILDDLITKSAIYPTKKAKPSADAVITNPVESPVEKAEPVKTISVNEIAEILKEKRDFKQPTIPSVATELRSTPFFARVGMGNLLSQAKNLYKKTATLSIILVIAILGAIIALGYSIVVPEPDARFTEFFILGIDGKASDYPTEFTMDNGKVTQVKYGDATNEATAGDGLLTLGIVNHEQQTEVYSVEMIIDNEPVSINFEGKTVTILGPIELQKGQNWENAIGIIPQHTGDDQEVDLLLFKGKETAPEDSLHLFINVKEAA